MKMLRSQIRMATILCALAGFVVGFRALPALFRGHTRRERAAATIAVHGLSPGAPRRDPQDYFSGPAGTLSHSIGGQPPAPRRAARGCLAEDSARIHRDAICHGPAESATHPARAERRSVRGGERTGTHPGAARDRRGWQGADRGNIRHGIDAALRHRVLPAWQRPAICLCGEHRLGGALPVPQRRSEGARRGADHRSRYPFRRPFDRRRTLDAGSGLHTRWQQDVCLSRLALQ